MRFAIVPPAAQALTVQGFDRDLALSPDGTHLVYVAGSDAHLMVRAIDQLDAVPLRGITGARQSVPLARRPLGGLLHRSGRRDQEGVDRGGPALPLCPITGGPRGASWGPDDTIIFATNDASTGLLRVSPPRAASRQS